MSTTHPKHRRHEWSAIREYRVPKAEPRHRADRTREHLGAESPAIKQLFADLASNPFQGGRAR